MQRETDGGKGGDANHDEGNEGEGQILWDVALAIMIALNTVQIVNVERR